MAKFSKNKTALKAANTIICVSKSLKTLKKDVSAVPNALLTQLSDAASAQKFKGDGVFSYDISPKQKIIFSSLKDSTYKALVEARSALKLAHGQVTIVGLIDETVVDAFVSAGEVGTYNLPQFKSKNPPQKVLKLTFFCDPLGDPQRSKAIAKRTNTVRELAVLPANKLDPESYIKRIKDDAKTLGLKVKVYDYTQLKKMGAGAFCAVAQAAKRGGIVKLSYRGGGQNQTLALVGKGITYDTGGLCVKPPQYMFGMQGDMTGSAVAFSLMCLAAEQKWPINVDTYLAITDNSISEDAFRPNEVVTTLSGRTIETVHTDAEGRMALADTLCLASEEKPDLIMDYATLTGSAVRAIGTRYSCVFSNDESLFETLIKTGQKSGERVWPFPFDDDTAADLKSDIADTKQCRLEGGPDHIEAASFLNSFVKKGVKWIHMDLSACENTDGLAHVPSKVTGFGVKFSEQFIRDYFSF